MKFLIVDDHELIRAGLRPVLNRLDNGNVIVLEAWNYLSAQALLDEHMDLDLILLDLNLPGIAGFAALEGISNSAPEIPVVIISETSDKDIILASFKLGACGFIPKSSPCQVMSSAINIVLRGGIYVPPDILASYPLVHSNQIKINKSANREYSEPDSDNSLYLV